MNENFKNIIQSIKMKFLSEIIKYAKKYRIAVNVNFDYKIPQDLQTKIYDFYMLNYLHDGISEKDYQQLANDKYNNLYRNEKQIEAQININNAYNKLCQNLKIQLMNLLYYQIAREFSHAPYFYKEIITKELVKNILTKTQMKFFNDYLKICKNKKISETLKDSDFSKAKEIIDQLNPDKIFFVKLANKIFKILITDNGYGGKNWQQICNAYLMFFDSPIGTAIDHVFDLQHNTGNIFYKYPKYSELSQQITRILDEKKNLTNPIAFARKCSNSIQDACKYLLHLKDNVSQQQFKEQIDYYANRTLNRDQIIKILQNKDYKKIQDAYNTDRITVEDLIFCVQHFLKQKEYVIASNLLIGFESNLPQESITLEYIDWLCKNNVNSILCIFIKDQKINSDIVTDTFFKQINKLINRKYPNLDEITIQNMLQYMITYSPIDIINKLVDSNSDTLITIAIDNQIINKENTTNKLQQYLRKNNIKISTKLYKISLLIKS